MVPLILSLSSIHWMGWVSSRDIWKCLERTKAYCPAGDDPVGSPAINPLPTKAVFLNRRATARYRALASFMSGRERPDETTICYKISLVQLITNINVILYLSTCHTVYISVLILFMIMP